MKFLIVGGSSGIGLACTEQLLEEDHEVLVASRSASGVQHLAVEHLEIDVTGDVSALEDIDQLDGLVYCPGTINLKPFKRLTTEDFQRDFEINVLGAVKVIQALAPALKSNSGSVILFSTVAVTQGMPFHASVAASKAAIEGLSRSLAAEYAPHIRFNVLAPSLCDTPLAESLLNNENKRDAAEERHPLKRVGQPADVATMAVSLLANKGWVTGQVIGVDGGLSVLR